MASPHFLDVLAAYVPTPVAQAIYHQPRVPSEPTAQRFLAAVLFTDISGFTPLAEALSQSGPTGAEELTHLINLYFTSMIEIVQTYHGQVVKFSGDALTVLFKAEKISLTEAVRRAGECALTMQTRMGDFAQLRTSRGRASLSMKAGIGAGEVLACTIGGVAGHWEYVVGAAPLVQVALAERYAKPGQTVFSPQAWVVAAPFFEIEGQLNDQGFARVSQVTTCLPVLTPEPLDWLHLTPAQQTLANDALRCYVPIAVKDRLGESADWLAELRRITVLFIGVAGFDYAAANVVEKLQDFFVATQKVVDRYEGSLNKLAVDDKGTVLLILFGAAPFSHEDDIMRAVACALDLQAVAQAQQLRMVIGISEGGLFAGPVGAPSRREYTVIGDTVNLAARLMQYGNIGQIVISQRVKERAGVQFIFESLGQISLKGRADTTPAFLVKGERESRDEFISRYLLYEEPLVNRTDELAQLREAAGLVRQAGLQLLFLEGELGLGKTRLVAELVREWMMSGGVSYGSKCISYGRQTPYQAWREVLSEMCGLTPTLSPQRKLARLNTSIADLPNPPGQPSYWKLRLPLLADVLGIEVTSNQFTRSISGQLRRNNTFALVEAMLRRHAQRHPLFILLEDIQWADELSLSLMVYLAKTLLDLPLLMGLVHRPLLKAETNLLVEVKRLPYVHTIHLNPLSPVDSLELVRILMGNHSLPPDIEEIVLSRGQGNPFFLQEMTGAILDVLENQADQAVKRMDALNLPDTVQDVILSRVDRLSEAHKLTLKIASVIGPSFQRSMLSVIHPLLESQNLLSVQLEDLEKEKLIRLEAAAPKWEYNFYNVITQEVVYEGLLLAQRRQLHQAIGQSLENFLPDEVEQLAFHYSRSGDRDKAIHYLELAGHKARREYAIYAAITYYSEILEHLSQQVAEHGGTIVSVQYWDILLELARLHNVIGLRDKELEDLGTLGVMAEALEDNARRAVAAKQWANLYETSGDYDSGLEMIERCVHLAQEAGDEELLGQGYNHWGKLLYLRGDYETAHDYLQRALEIAQNCQDKHTQADCLNNLGIVAGYQNDYEVALYFFDEALALWRDLGDRLGEGNALSSLGRVHYEMGQYFIAQHCFNQALTLLQAIGDRVGEALTRRGLGQVYCTLGNFSAAQKLFNEALALYQDMGDRHGEALTRYQLGFLHTRLGEFDTAIALLEAAIITLREFADYWALGSALTYYGWTLYESGQLRPAKKSLEEVLKIQRDTHQEVKRMESVAHLGRVALALHDLTLADTCLRWATDFIANRSTLGIEHPAMVYLIAYQVLRAKTQFEPAQAMLARGQEYLNDQLAQIDNPDLQQSYIQNIPENRYIYQTNRQPEP